MYEDWKSGRKISPNSLHLDDRNPRLIGTAQGKAQRQVLDTLLEAESAAIREIARSIVAKGYFPPSEVIVIEVDGKRVVVEGNCRVAACKLLANARQTSIDNERKYFESQQKKLTPEVMDTFKRIPCVEAPSREAARIYIEDRHTGRPVNQWSRYAQGEFYRDELRNGVQLELLSERYSKPKSELLELIRIAELSDKIGQIEWADEFTELAPENSRVLGSIADTIIRLFGFLVARDKLGDRFRISDDGALLPETDDEVALDLLASLVAEASFETDDGNKPFLTTRSINARSDVESYLEDFETRGGTRKKYRRKKKPTESASTPNQSTKTTAKPATGPSRKPRDTDKWLLRRHLIDHSITDPRIRQMVLEGERLQWRRDYYASALLIRGLLECCLRERLKKVGKWTALTKKYGSSRVPFRNIIDFAKSIPDLFDDEAVFEAFKKDAGELKNRIHSKLSFVQHNDKYLLTPDDVSYIRQKTMNIIRDLCKGL